MAIKKFDDFVGGKPEEIGNESLKELILDTLLPLTDEGFLPRVDTPRSLSVDPEDHLKVLAKMKKCYIQLEKPIKTTGIKSDIHGEVDKIKKMNDLIYANIHSIIKRLEEFGEITLYEDTAAIRGYIKIELALNETYKKNI